MSTRRTVWYVSIDICWAKSVDDLFEIVRENCPWVGHRHRKWISNKDAVSSGSRGEWNWLYSWFLFIHQSTSRYEKNHILESRTHTVAGDWRPTFLWRTISPWAIGNRFCLRIAVAHALMKPERSGPNAQQIINVARNLCIHRIITSVFILKISETHMVIHLSMFISQFCSSSFHRFFPSIIEPLAKSQKCPRTLLLRTSILWIWFPPHLSIYWKSEVLRRLSPIDATLRFRLRLSPKRRLRHRNPYSSHLKSTENMLRKWIPQRLSPQRRWRLRCCTPFATWHLLPI